MSQSLFEEKTSLTFNICSKIAIFSVKNSKDNIYKGKHILAGLSSFKNVVKMTFSPETRKSFNELILEH